MALKDRLNDTLASTPPAEKTRQETLRAVLDAAGGGSDAEIQAALARIISAREQKAASYSAAGQTELARTERGEIDALRGLLRLAGDAPPPPPKQPKKSAAPSEPAASPEPVKPLFSRLQMIFGGIAIVILAVVVIVLLRSSGENEGGLTATSAGKIAVYKDDRTLGNPNAPVVFLEYAAPTCPHCAHFAIEDMPAIKKKYIETGKVFYIFRNFPLQATDGAVEGLARCLPADKYFDFLDLMFRNQSKWDPDSLNPPPDVGAALIQMARIVGMSPERAKQCMEDRSVQDRVNQIAQDGELKYRIDHTPTFVINGEVVNVPLGSESGEVVQNRIEALLSKR